MTTHVNGRVQYTKWRLYEKTGLFLVRCHILHTPRGADCFEKYSTYFTLQSYILETRANQWTLVDGMGHIPQTTRDVLSTTWRDWRSLTSGVCTEPHMRDSN